LQDIETQELLIFYNQSTNQSINNNMVEARSGETRATTVPLNFKY